MADYRIDGSELIINAKGNIYHIDMHPDELADTVITVGDPDRVERVSRHFDSIESKSQHREFVSHTGRLGNKRITVISTGIGPDNIDIVLNELDALANIDFATQTIKPKFRRLNIIRLGTAGSLHREIDVDEWVVSSHGMGLDNLLHFYDHPADESVQELLADILNSVPEARHLNPYLVSAGDIATHFRQEGFHHGITVTCPGFYAPQGRRLRSIPAFPKMIEQLSSFQMGNIRVLNFEMETSAIYGLGFVLGHNCVSISNIVANRIRGTFTKDTQTAVDKMISKVLEILPSI